MKSGEDIARNEVSIEHRELSEVSLKSDEESEIHEEAEARQQPAICWAQSPH